MFACTVKKSRIHIVLLFLLGGIYLFIPSCTHKNSQVICDTVGLRNGDLLFRMGMGYESHVVSDVSNGEYSHIGLAWHNGKQWCAIHAVPGENEKGEPEYLKCEPIGEFFRPDRAQAGARARVNCSDSIADAAARHAYQLVQRKVLFDNDYNTSDSSRLYCTELVKQVYSPLNIDLCEDRYHLPPVISDGPVYYPEDIWNSPLLQNKKKLKTTF